MKTKDKLTFTSIKRDTEESEEKQKKKIWTDSVNFKIHSFTR